jgi:MOSC domain-containing protein YiiM
MTGVQTVEIQYWGHLVWEKYSPENMAENITVEPHHSESPGSLC